MSYAVTITGDATSSNTRNFAMLLDGANNHISFRDAATPSNERQISGGLIFLVYYQVYKFIHILP